MGTHEKGQRKDRISRRTLLNLGWKSMAGLGAASLLGCSPQNLLEDEASLKAAQASGKGFVSPVRASWYSDMDDGSVRCELCPHQCIVEPSDRGACRVRENRDTGLYTLAYGNPVVVQDDPVERNPFFHVRPGTRSLSLSTAGCNLACRFCEVWDMALVAPEDVHAHDMPPQRVLEHAQATGVGAVCYSFGEPVVFYEYMTAIAKLAKQAGMLNLMQTAGYIQPEPLTELCGYLDAVNVDLKGFDSKFYREAVGGELEPVLRTLRQLRDAKIHIEITNLLIPTLNDDLDSIGDMCRWIADELGPDVPLHFARFYPLYKLIDLPRTPASALDKARETALEAGLRYVYVARVPGHEGENTFCPGCGKTIIVREGFIIDENHVENGSCHFCGTRIPGHFS